MRKLVLIIFSIVLHQSICSQELSAGFGLNHMRSLKKGGYDLTFGYQNKFLSRNTDYAKKVFGFNPYVTYYSKNFWKFSVSGSAKYLHYFDGLTLDLLVGKGLNRFITVDAGFSLFKGDYDPNYSQAIIGTPDKSLDELDSYSSDYSYIDYAIALNTPESNDTIPNRYKKNNMFIPYFKLGWSLNYRRLTIGANWYISVKDIYAYHLVYNTDDYEKSNFNYMNTYIRYNLFTHHFSKDQNSQKDKINRILHHWRWNISLGVEVNKHLFTTPVNAFYYYNEDFSSNAYTSSAENTLYNGYTYDYQVLIKSSPILKLGIELALTKRLSVACQAGIGTIAFRQRGTVVYANGSPSYRYFDNTHLKPNLFWSTNENDSYNNIWKKLNVNVMYTLIQRKWSLDVLAGLALNKIKQPWSIPEYSLGTNNGYRIGCKVNYRRFEVEIFNENFIGLKGSKGDRLEYSVIGGAIAYKLFRINNFNNTILK